MDGKTIYENLTAIHAGLPERLQELFAETMLSLAQPLVALERRQQGYLAIQCWYRDHGYADDPS